MLQVDLTPKPCRNSRRPRSALRAGVRALLITAVLLGAASVLEAHTPVTSRYRYYADVAPVFSKQCGKCHRPSGPAPMSLLTYKDVRPWAEAIKEQVIEGSMPPRFAKPGASRLKHTRPLSARELDTIVDWAAGGAPPGKPSSAASTPSTTATTALDQTWRRHVLDLTLPSGKDAVTLLRTLSPDDAAKTIRGWTIEPDAADSPLRHVLLFAVSGTDKTAPHSAFDSWTAVPRAWRPASGFLGSWLPDQPPQEWPKGWGRPWHANDRLVLLATLRRSFKHGNTPRRARAALRVLWEAQAPQVALRAAPVSEVSEASTENARVVGFFPGATTGPATLSIVSATTNEAPAEPILEILHAPAAWPATYWLDPAQPLIKTSQLRWRPSAEVQAPGIIVTAP